MVWIYKDSDNRGSDKQESCIDHKSNAPSIIRWLKYAVKHFVYHFCKPILCLLLRPIMHCTFSYHMWLHGLVVVQGSGNMQNAPLQTDVVLALVLTELKPNFVQHGLSVHTLCLELFSWVALQHLRWIMQNSYCKMGNFNSVKFDSWGFKYVFFNLAMFNFGELARIFYCTRLVLGFYFDCHRVNIKMTTKLPILR